MKKIVVIGAGPAGMMSAIRAAQLKQDVTLIEKNSSPGKKLLLSGKGRCNLTNLCDLDSFLTRFPKRAEFLRDAFKKFFNQDLIDFFESRGLKLKTERQLRVFPKTDHANSVLEVLEKELLKLKVNILYRTEVKDILVKEKKAYGVLLSDGKVLKAQRIIMACGGLSYPATGSCGDGFKIAKKLGHTIADLQPGLVALVTKESYPSDLEGLTLKNIQLKFSSGGKQIISEIGELIFTSFGVSGPLILTLSNKIIDWQKQAEEIILEIDLKPALTKEQLDARLLREFKTNAKKTIKNTLKSLLPERLINLFLKIAKIPAAKLVSQISKEERSAIVLLLKALPLTIKGSRPIEEAMVTRGGVSLKEINPRTMESRLVKGLYFAGEMIDVDADTGGFNLQAAFSTGYLAGESAALS